MTKSSCVQKYYRRKQKDFNELQNSFQLAELEKHWQSNLRTTQTKKALTRIFCYLDQDALEPRYKLLNCRNHENENENNKQKANEDEEEEEELTRGAPAASRARRRHEATNKKKTVACCGLFLVCFRAAGMKFRIRCRGVAVPAALIHAEPICWINIALHNMQPCNWQ